ncbi:hypothetical protein RF11_08002 [Thelohanellus kitauei]|uniref:Uncharacterized protein n=1 Tax=Thelohanellus kitauei TaxID=669202 RepID=A0A0C2N173_THEKT|nr:hypothetical protein RF11_08002 [Thelohanellus kitauei]
MQYFLYETILQLPAYRAAEIKILPGKNVDEASRYMSIVLKELDSQYRQNQQYFNCLLRLVCSMKIDTVIYKINISGLLPKSNSNEISRFCHRSIPLPVE